MIVCNVRKRAVFNIEDDKTWRLIAKSEFKEENLDNYMYMTYTSNHLVAAINKAVGIKPKLASGYERIQCHLVFCENATQANLLGKDDNETADQHMSSTWWDRCVKFRRIWNMEKPAVVNQEWQFHVLELAGLKATNAVLKTHRDVFNLAFISEPLFKLLVDFQSWYVNLENPTDATKKRYISMQMFDVIMVNPDVCIMYAKIVKAQG